MNFSIQKEASFDLRTKLSEIGEISDYLKKELSTRSYGSVRSCIITFHCINPEMMPGNVDFETGHVIDKKFTKSSGLLVMTMKLNYSEVISGKDLKDLLIKGLYKANNEIDGLVIPDFRFSDLVTDIEKLLTKPNLNVSDFRDNSPFISEIPLPKEFPPHVVMDEERFWGIIAKSLSAKTDQLSFLVQYLKDCEVGEIIGFECRIRQLLMESHHYNVLALHKIISEVISTDSFLYFRCNLILLGEEVFKRAISNPNSFDKKLTLLPASEHLLSVPDKAFYEKFGKDTHQEAPSDFASQFVDYSFEAYEMKGREWELDELIHRYPNLWYRYRPVN